MARGIEGSTIFRDEEDRNRFLFLLAEGIAKSGFECYAWALMTNHYHLVIRTNECPLADLLHPLNARYARWFRAKGHSHGYLFQDRFKSLVTQDQGYLEELVRYVHLNPIRKGICSTISDLDVYPWCGHAALVGTIPRSFQETRKVLERFSVDHLRAIKQYRSFMQEGHVMNKPDGLIDAVRHGTGESVDQGDCHLWVIGDQPFVKNAIDADHARRLQLALYSQEGWTMEKVTRAVSRQMKLDPRDVAIRSRGNDRSALRKVVAALAHRTLGIPVAEVARFLGIRSSSVTRMIDAGDSIVQQRGISLNH
jgi:REP element-mobilizing transposase RayT